MQSFGIIISIIYIVVFIVGLVGNTLVIHVVRKHSTMHTVTNLYIVNLAVADLCYLFSLPFVLTSMWLGGWAFGTIACKIYWSLTIANQFASNLLLVILSADRYLAVCHATTSDHWRTMMVAKLSSSLVWSVGVVMAIPLLVYARDESGHCTIFWPESVDGINGSVVFTAFTFVVTFAFPLSALSFFYTCMVRYLHSVVPTVDARTPKLSASTRDTTVRISGASTQNMTSTDGAESQISCCHSLHPTTVERRRNLLLIQKRIYRRNRRIVRLVIAIILVYFGCYLPFWISQIWLLAQSAEGINTNKNPTNYYNKEIIKNIEYLKNMSNNMVELNFSPLNFSSQSFSLNASQYQQKSNLQNRTLQQQIKNDRANTNQQGNRSMVVFMFMLAFALTYCNSAINPVLYTFLHENFRTPILNAFGCYRPNVARNSIPMTTLSSSRKQKPRNQQQEQIQLGSSSAKTAPGVAQLSHPVFRYGMSINEDVKVNSLDTSRRISIFDETSHQSAARARQIIQIDYEIKRMNTEILI